MGIIKWFSDRWNKPEEAAQEPLTVGTEHIVGDDTRVKNYIDGGGEIVDLSNKPRKDNDGFPPDRELMTPFNEAHVGTKAGLAGVIGRKR
jgi:hypothetical protein